MCTDLSHEEGEILKVSVPLHLAARTEDTLVTYVQDSSALAHVPGFEAIAGIAETSNEM